MSKKLTLNELGAICLGWRSVKCPVHEDSLDWFDGQSQISICGVEDAPSCPDIDFKDKPNKDQLWNVQRLKRRSTSWNRTGYVDALREELCIPPAYHDLGTEGDILAATDVQERNAALRTLCPDEYRENLEEVLK